MQRKILALGGITWATVRRLIILVSASLALLAASPAGAATVAVSITKDGFVPRDVTVQVGDTVTWTNSDTSVHQVQATNGAFLSPPLTNGQSFSYTFTSAGKVNYQDPNLKKLKGSVTAVAPAAASVSISVSKTTVLFGSAATLSGQISTGTAGEAVVVFGKAFGQSDFTQVASLTTGSGGAWSVAVKPSIGTTYEARWKGVASAQLAVSVRPRVTLAVKPGGLFVTSVAPGMTGKTVFLQRWSVTLKAWITVKKSKLGARSSSRIVWRPAKGDYKVRVLLPAKQAGPGYLAGVSAARIYVRA